MRIILLGNKRIIRLIVPEKIEGSFWLTDEQDKKIINIESVEGKWFFKANDDTKIIANNSYVNQIEVIPGCFYSIEHSGIQYVLYAENLIDNSVAYYNVSNGYNITIGKDNNCVITYDNQYIQNDYLTLSYSEDGWHLKIGNNSRVYVNDYLITSLEKKLYFGDNLIIYGLRINLYKGIIAINNSFNKVIINGLSNVRFNCYSSTNNTIIDSNQIKEVDLYKDDDYFFKTPRVRRFIETYKLNLTSPPASVKQEETPILLVLGPSLTMGIVSLVTTFNLINSILSNGKKLSDCFSTLIISVVSLISSLVWPNLTRSYQKKLNKRREKERISKYKNYLGNKKNDLSREYENQKSILCENLISVKECEKIILDRSRNLWERRIDQRDFLTVRIGNGTVPLDIDYQKTEEEFKMEEDILKNSVSDMIREYTKIDNVPVSYSFLNKNITAVMGNKEETLAFMDNIILQLVSFHSYDDLKIVFLTNKDNSSVWDRYRGLPHCFSNDKTIRYYANDLDEIKYVSTSIMDEYNSRKDNVNSAIQTEEEKTKTYSPYYLIITDDYPFVRKIDIIQSIVSNKANFGYSLICLDDRLSKLPSTCEDFILLDKEASILSTHIDNYFQQGFNKEIDYSIDINTCVERLANVPIEFTFESKKLPNSYGFLEMYGIGKVEQLNLLNRWRTNDPIKSLKAPIGVNDEGELIYLDLHEKFHGPHGLIGGTTGSGKSEFIITYILSMAVNYSPNEVAFILIDYKGGGLAGAFENKTLGLRLPHLAGTITNLDKASLNRTLVSINSELQRRQMKFNEVRDKLGESTIDIYKYQKFFREGKIDEPMPHLFIISDEFAELKSQQPEFMNDLISTARIGRSLGVHLILATQKPSGVVNDQIWSNTKFRVCLKVAETGDSNGMIKKPDAAYITNAGRFYLQVGNDEIYVLGQSGWAGTPYVGAEMIKKKHDRALTFIDDVGNVTKSVDDINNIGAGNELGDELGNIMKYICSLADKENLRTRNLWLPAIPGVIYVDDLVKKYKYKPEGISAIIGEYDAPSNQSQGLLTTRFDEEGNTLVIGNTPSCREMFMSTLIYSLCTSYVANDVNIYVVDFGSETLRMFDKFPQVGDMIYVSDKDKLTKLFELLESELENRKKILSEYNGDYKLYNKKNEKKLALKIVMINNYDSFKENYSSMEEYINVFTRDCERYGIVFVITASSLNLIFRKVRTNFHSLYMLDMKERSDYMDAFGKIGNVFPANYDGRGMFSNDGIYEFQTALVHDADTLFDFIKEKVESIKKVSSVVAPNIPSLPDIVTYDMMFNNLKSIDKLPIGIIKDNLKIAYYDFFTEGSTVISSKNVLYCLDLLKTIIYEIRKLNHMVVLIDAEQKFSSLGGMVNTYADKNFEEFILQFEKFLDKEVDGKNINVLCIISGLEKFQGSVENKKFKGFFKGIKTFKNVRLLLVDSSFKIKKVSYEDWYTSTVSNTNGIWVGDGFAEQSVFRYSSQNADFRAHFNNQYAFMLKNDECLLIKIPGNGVVIDEE